MAKQRQIPNDTNIIYYHPEDILPEEAYLNETACYSPDDYFNKECHNCSHVMRCVYRNKYKYMKIG